MKKIFVSAVVIITLLLGLYVLYVQFYDDSAFQQTDSIAQQEPEKPADTDLVVHYIDVGQADSTLVVCNGEALLIDAGERETSGKLIKYIKSLGIERFKYVVATHPHSDHIGAMEDILNSFGCDNFMMPNCTNNTVSFEYMLKAIDEKGIKATVPKPGDKFKVGGAEFTVLSPPADLQSDNLNNYSIVLRGIKDKTAFMFMADAEGDIESTLLNGDFDLTTDVLKVPHHGSSTSSTKEFIEAADPEYGIISCGIDNTYNHPNKNVVKRYEDQGVILYETAQDGTIIARTDGTKIDFSFVKGGSNGQ